MFWYKVSPINEVVFPSMCREKIKSIIRGEYASFLASLYKTGKEIPLLEVFHMKNADELSLLTEIGQNVCIF